MGLLQLGRDALDIFSGSNTTARDNAMPTEEGRERARKDMAVAMAAKHGRRILSDPRLSPGFRSLLDPYQEVIEVHPYSPR